MDTGRNTPRLLVVDDEPMIGRALEMLLRDRYSVQSVQSVDEARRRFLTGFRAELVLCDISMPGGSGTQLWQWLEHHRPRVCLQFAFMSGDPQSAEAREAIGKTGVSCLQKPFDLLELEETLRELSERYCDCESLTRAAQRFAGEPAEPAFVLREST